MPTRIELLETANRQANGHITELSNQLAEKYAEIEKLENLIEAVRGGDPLKGHESCTDCGRRMVWQRDKTSSYQGSWMCPNCVCRRMDKAKAEIKKLEKENAELLDQRIKDLAALASEHRAIQMGRW